MYKATTDVNVELSNLSQFKTLSNLIMWVWSYRMRSLTRFGGVDGMVVEHVTAYYL